MVAQIVPWLIENPEIGWVASLLYLMWEIRGPKGKINDLAERIEGVVVVVRALAQVHDDIDTERVDEYLTRNGNEPSDFIRNPKENQSYSRTRYDDLRSAEDAGREAEGEAEDQSNAGAD